MQPMGENWSHLEQLLTFFLDFLKIGVRQVRRRHAITSSYASTATICPGKGPCRGTDAPAADIWHHCRSWCPWYHSFNAYVVISYKTELYTGDRQLSGFQVR